MKPPQHLPRGHLTRQYSVYLVAYGASDVVLSLHLLLKAFLVKAVISALTHYDNLYRRLLPHLFLVPLFDFCLSFVETVIQLAHANWACLVLALLPMTLPLLVLNFLQQLPGRHLNETGYPAEFGCGVVSEGLRCKQGRQIWVGFGGRLRVRLVLRFFLRTIGSRGGP